MLTLGRREGEGILIGDVLVVVTRNQGGVVRLSIDAPRDTNIARTELLPAEQQAELHQRAFPRRRVAAG